MVATRRSSQRLLKKAKLESSHEAEQIEEVTQPMDLDGDDNNSTTEFSMIISDDDFQQPDMVSVRIRSKGKQPMRSTQSSRSRIDMIKQEASTSDSSRKRTLRSRSNTPLYSFDSDDETTLIGTTTGEESIEDNSAVGSSSATPASLTEFHSGSQQVSTQDDDFDSSDNASDGEDDNSSIATSSDEETVVPERRRQLFDFTRTRTPHYIKTQEKIIAKHKELGNVWENLEKIKPADVVPIEQPAELTLPLLPFQKYGVGWMLAQEKMDEFKGGILADEMGMGKTIQTIALLLSDRKKPNLVIAPTVAILQWKNEIEKHTNNALSVYVFHGHNRTKDAKELQQYDVVLSTYSIMESCFRRQEYGVKSQATKTIRKEKSLLHKIKWNRVILDEAHNIKDRSSNTARSVFNVEGKYKWSLTGTPLQNRVGELYSLIRFMQADPFAYYYCKNCPCKELTWKFSDKRTCDTCGHTPMNHVCWWNNEVLKPIQMHGYVGDGKKALTKLCLLLDRIMLRRTKVECADDLGLPPRTVIVRRDLFNEEEEDVYTSLYSDVRREFNNYVEEGTVLNNYANIFELLMKMRQCADHPDLVTKKSTDSKQLVCMLCNDPPEDAIAAACKHVFCRECCVQYYNSFDDETGEKPRCPSCFAEFSVDLTQPAMEVESGSGTNANYSKSSIVNRINMDKWRSSTKIEALVEELSNLRREDKLIKSIVFSQFVNFLDLVYWRLSRAGFECIRLDGTMTPDQRNAAINHFMTKPTVTVFLISLKAGGVALNLTEASRVFICDPWWNPAAELQAMDRIHRLGQYRPIRITRLIIENSIESRIVQLQEKKTALVESTVGKNSKALDKLTVEDLRFLFVM